MEGCQHPHRVLHSNIDHRELRHHCPMCNIHVIHARWSEHKDYENIKTMQDMNQETKPSIKKPKKPGKKLWANTNIKSNRSGGEGECVRSPRQSVQDISRSEAAAYARSSLPGEVAAKQSSWGSFS